MCAKYRKYIKVLEMHFETFPISYLLYVVITYVIVYVRSLEPSNLY